MGGYPRASAPLLWEDTGKRGALVLIAAWDMTDLMWTIQGAQKCLCAKRNVCAPHALAMVPTPRAR